MVNGPPGWFWGFFAFWLVFAIGGTVLWIWMLVDAVRVPDERFYRSGNKVLWIVLIAVLQVFGAIAYLVAARPAKEVRARWRPGGDLYEVRWTHAPGPAPPRAGAPQPPAPAAPQPGAPTPVPPPPPPRHPGAP